MTLAVEVSAALVNLVVITVVLTPFRGMMGRGYLLVYSLVPSMGIYLAVLRNSVTLRGALYIVYLAYLAMAVGLLLVLGEDKNKKTQYYRVFLYFLAILIVAALAENGKLLALAMGGFPLMVLLSKRGLVHEIVGFNALSAVVGVVSVLDLNLIQTSNHSLSSPNTSIVVALILFQQVIYSMTAFYELQRY
ncbi:hypothetical protein [Thermococcus sp. 21S7]|uniref:hypothetical protein n=1 Tax=Thermococcus sp. 21S7 TaxID=1638221 RepID=UPI00143887F6|nr:hypothetical protein [Thermococcus sp. 21S7]NJE61903.1 hypothetical protein [Thermococcus sp. 21S7]